MLPVSSSLLIDWFCTGPWRLHMFVTVLVQCTVHSRVLVSNKYYLCKLIRRTAAIPKKVSSADQPTIALVDTAPSTKGHVVLIATCKLQTTFVLNGSNLATYASRFPMMQSMQAIRKLVSAKASTSVNCLVLYNVCMKRTESTSHPFECKLRLGWGVANLTTAYQSIAKFATKTTTHAEDHDNHASDSARPSVESQTCALAF